MRKVIRLTERDLKNIVKRVISEQEKDDMADKVETAIEKPKVEMKIEDIYSQLSDEEKEELKNTLEDLGIDEYSSAKEVHSKIEDAAGDDVVNGEMSEEDESPRKKAAQILHLIGAGNIAAWGGVPAAIAIGASLVGTVASPMVAGFAISWGVTTLLMGLAKLIHKDSDSVNENYKRRNRRRY